MEKEFLGQVASFAMRYKIKIGLTHESKFMAALIFDTLHYRNMYNLDLSILGRCIADLTILHNYIVLIIKYKYDMICTLSHINVEVVIS